MDVSIIIVNYNTRALLADCIQSVLSQTQEIEYEIIVVDNDSKDDSASYIKKHYPSVMFIHSGGNLGFGRANNLGAKFASGKYLFLLNSDTILKNNAVYMFFQYMEQQGSNDCIGAVGGYLLDREGNYGAFYVDFPSPILEYSRLLRKYLYPQAFLASGVLDVDGIIGADLFLPKSIFTALDGFDPSFFMYFEETDLQYRMSKLGWKRQIIPGPQIVHLEGGSFNKNGLSYKRYVMAQNSYNYYCRKHFKSLKRLAVWISLLVVRLFVFITPNWTIKERVKAYQLVIKGLF
jgi:hypothetical protein